MKRISSLLLLGLVCCLSFAGERQLKVMSYNLRFGELASMEELGRYILSESPDIVALQELDWATYRELAPHQHGVKFINELADATGMFGLYGKAIDYKKGYYGVGILSRYPIVRSERILLPNPGNHEQRIMLVADIELPEGEIVTFVSTHLAVETAGARMAQVRFIIRELKGRGHYILAGDMNAEPDSPEMQYLGKYWKNLTNDDLTYSSSRPEIKIDYIFGRPAKDFKLESTMVVGETKLSDHFPIISNITVYL